MNNRLYSLLNIGGLALGISVCMLILLYVAYDWSYDRFHPNAGRIFYPGISMIKINDNNGFFSRMSYVSGLATLLVAIATVGVQAYRSAAANPVKSLRMD